MRYLALLWLAVDVLLNFYSFIIKSGIVIVIDIVMVIGYCGVMFIGRHNAVFKVVTITNWLRPQIILN